MARERMTAMDVIRQAMARHIGDGDYRGHMAGCGGYMRYSDGRQHACTALCIDARRIVDEGDSVQLEMVER